MLCTSRPVRPAQPKSRKTNSLKLQRGEEPPVLAARVTLLQGLLDSLLGVLTLGDLLEGVGGQSTLEALELQGVTGGHQVVVVDDLDEGLDLGSLLLSCLGHATGDLAGVALDTGDQGVAVGVRLVASVDGLDDHDLLSGIAATGDDGNTANLEELHFGTHHQTATQLLEISKLLRY